MPKKSKKTNEAGHPDDYWTEGPHPRGERNVSLLESLEEELGLAELFQGTMEAPSTPEPSAAVARRARQQPVDANLASMFAEPASRADIFDDVDADNILGDFFGDGNVEMSGDDDDDEEKDDGDEDDDNNVDDDVAINTAPRSDPNVSFAAAGPGEVDVGVLYGVDRPATSRVM